MRVVKLKTLIISILSIANIGMAKDLPTPGNGADNPCNPFFPETCEKVPLNDNIHLLIFMGLILGVIYLSYTKRIKT